MFMDSLHDAVHELAQQMVEDAQQTDPDQWTYVSRVFSFQPGAETMTVRVASWTGRLGREFTGVLIDGASSVRFLSESMARTNKPRTAIIRVTRMPSLDDDQPGDLYIEYQERAAPEPVDITDRETGAHSLFAALTR